MKNTDVYLIFFGGIKKDVLSDRGGRQWGGGACPSGRIRLDTEVGTGRSTRLRTWLALRRWKDHEGDICEFQKNTTLPVTRENEDAGTDECSSCTARQFKLTFLRVMKGQLSSSVLLEDLLHFHSMSKVTWCHRMYSSKVNLVFCNLYLRSTHS